MRDVAHDPQKKILHICKVFLPVKGGVQRVVYNITKLLTDYSHSVLTTGQDGAIPHETINGANVYRQRSYLDIASMPISPSLFVQALRRARKHDLVVVHYPFPLAELAVLLLPFALPIVVHWHSEVIAQKKLKWLVAPITFLLLARAKSIVVTSKKMVAPSFYLRFYEHKITFIPYGLDEIETSNLNNKSGQDYFIIVGRHVSYKGINIAIDALKQTQANLIICGDGPLFEKNKKLASDLKLNDRITFLTHASDTEIIVLLKQAKALLVPSISENEAFALVQLEAMRLGKAVINTDLNSSVPWVARDNKEAVTVPANDTDALAKAMQKLTADKDLCDRLGENGLKRYQEHFSMEKFSTAVNNLYQQILN